MNTRTLNQIFDNYISMFETINNTKSREYYKWEIARRFHDEMNLALESSTEEFPGKLYELKKLTYNLIDSYTQPFYGLVKFAQEEPETVREMFLNLYVEDGGDLSLRQQRIAEFLNQSHSLRAKYYPDSYLYKDDMHSVTGYLFLYDPNHNFIYKATHAHAFADCVEFYEDWGSGDLVRIDVYYRMCEQLVQEIKKNEALLRTDASRFDNHWGVDPTTLHPDAEKHILAFDLIYCCSTYNLYKGINFSRPDSKEKKLYLERRRKAVELSERLEEARQREQKFELEKEYINTVFAPGASLKYKSKGAGTVISNTGKTIEVEFSGQETLMKLGTLQSAALGIITSDAEGYEERIEESRKLLTMEREIKNAVKRAEKELEPYIEFLE